MNPFLATDGYKTGHHRMYPQGTTLVYSNFTPRSSKYAPEGCDKIVSFGQQMVMRQIYEMFNQDFFRVEDRARYKMLGWNLLPLRDLVCKEIKEEYSAYLGSDYDVSHIEALWDLGYLPVSVKAIPEGTLVPMGTPVLTIHNTIAEFYWLTNFLETLISTMLWKPMTSATIAHQYKNNLLKWALKTDEKNIGFVEFQGHDFSMRGMDSLDATISSGLGHATSFLGFDGLPVIHGARKFYDEVGDVGYSVNATEHSVMCAGGAGVGDELATFRYLMKQFPTGVLSIVSDTWDLWHVITNILPQLKEEILARDGKIVIRPDSGDPADIVCGLEVKPYDTLNSAKRHFKDILYNNQIHGEPDFDIPTKTLVKVGEEFFELEATASFDRYDKQYYFIEEIDVTDTKVEIAPKHKGVIELLWDLFGGTINEQGFKVLDPHIGAIYGDSITITRAEDICQRLYDKGFASTNIVFGIGSYTYQFNTRDTFGFAMKATYVELMTNIDGGDNEGSFLPIGRAIFKDPITDDGTKKSAKGLIKVNEDLSITDQVSWLEESKGMLQLIFLDGIFSNITTLGKVRESLRVLHESK